MAITAADYNNIRNKVITVLGTGSTGYGQTPVSSAATQQSSISATLWNNLRTDMLKARQHQTGRDETPFAPAVLNRTTTITEAIRVAFDNYANQIVTDQRLLGLDPISQAQSELFFTSTQYVANWNQTLYYRARVKFADNLQARYFFNAGGQIRFYAAKIDRTSSLTKDIEWDNILGTSTTKNGTSPGSGFGKVVYKYNSVEQLAGSFATAGTLTPQYSFYTAASSYVTSNLPTTATTIFTKSASAYSSNIYDIRMYSDSAASPTQLTFLIRFQDLAGGNVDEQNTGKLTQYVEILRPVVAGGVTVSGPSLALSAQAGITNDIAVAGS
jgi:hypothetical protein